MLKRSTVQLGKLCCLAACAALAAAAAQAQSWKPDKNVEIVAGAGPGGPVDIVARTLQRAIQDRKLVEQTSSVVNKAGGGGAVGWNYLKQHTGDANYISTVATSLITTPILGNVAFNYTDFTPIAQLLSEYHLYAVRPDSAVKSGGDLLDRFKTDPATLALGIAPAVGGVAHISFAVVAKAVGADVRKLKAVVFNTGPDSVTAVMGGHVDVVASIPSIMVPQMQAGKIRVLAIAAPQRQRGALAEVPTWREMGIDAVVENWIAVIGPKGMQPAQVAFWEKAIATAVQSEEWKAMLEKSLAAGTYRNSADTAQYFKTQNEEFRRILAEMGLVK
jgi:putative tricarboxylic transport membrane protein